MHGLGVGNQFVQHLRAVRKLLIIFAVLVQKTDSFAVTALCISKFFGVPIKVTELQQQHTFLYSAACRPGVSGFIACNSLCCILLRKVYVADSIIDLVEIFRVFV